MKVEVELTEVVERAAVTVQAENERMDLLEEEVRTLRDEMETVKAQFETFKQQFE